MKSLLSSVCFISMVVGGCGQKEAESSNKNFHMPPSNPPAEVVTIPADQWQQSQQPPQAETTFGLNARTLIANNTTKATRAPIMSRAKFMSLCDNTDLISKTEILRALYKKAGVTCAEAWVDVNKGTNFKMVWIQGRVDSLELVLPFTIEFLSTVETGATKSMLQPVIDQANQTGWLDIIDLPRGIYQSCPIRRDICEYLN